MTLDHIWSIVESLNVFVCHRNFPHHLASGNISCFVCYISRVCVPLCSPRNYTSISKGPCPSTSVHSVSPSAWNVLLNLVLLASWFWNCFLASSDSWDLWWLSTITSCANLTFITLFTNYWFSLLPFLLDSQGQESSNWISRALRVEWTIIIYLGIRK